MPPRPESRDIWRTFVEAWPLFEGTASGYWLRTQFDSVFRLGADLGDMSADASYDAIAAKLVEPGFRPRQLFKDFNIEVLATTDDPLDNLASHKAIAEDPTFARPRPADLPPGPVPEHCAPHLERQR